MRNQRLADAVRLGGFSVEDLAERVGVDAKTVHRWITTGRVPHLGSRTKVSSVLGVSSAMLWPEVPSVMDGTAELVGVYTTRAQLSPATIGSLLAGSSERIDVLAYGALWLWDAVRGFPDLLAAKASDGVEVRVCLGDPDCEAVRRRGEEEGIGDGLASRCRLAASYAAPLSRVDADAVRHSEATLYASMFRFDDDLLLNAHLWGNSASESPVFHLRRLDDRGVFANAVRSFERVWKESQLVPVR